MCRQLGGILCIASKELALGSWNQSDCTLSLVLDTSPKSLEDSIDCDILVDVPPNYSYRW